MWSGTLKLVFGNLSISLQSRTLALIFLKIPHFIQNYNFNPINKYLKISWSWGLGPRIMFCTIWVQMINQSINLELQFSQDLVISRTIKGIQWTYKISYLNQEGWDQKKKFWESRESTDESLSREDWWYLIIFKSIEFLNSLIEYLCLKHLLHTGNNLDYREASEKQKKGTW